MLRRERDSHGLFSSGETSDNDCEARSLTCKPSPAHPPPPRRFCSRDDGERPANPQIARFALPVSVWPSQVAAGCGEVDGPCLCEAGPRTPDSEACTPTPDTLLCEHCGKNRAMITRYSEGYGTEEECALSDPQGESDADADIEDTDCRLQEPGSLQRISSRRRKRPRVARQDTTESEDDGGRSHGPHRWNLRLSPDRAPSRTIPEVGPRDDSNDPREQEGKRCHGGRDVPPCKEAVPAQSRHPLTLISQESISQVRPLVVCQPNTERQKNDMDAPRGPTPLWPSSPSLPVILLLSLCLVILIVSFFLPLTGT